MTAADIARNNADKPMQALPVVLPEEEKMITYTTARSVVTTRKDPITGKDEKVRETILGERMTVSSSEIVWNKEVAAAIAAGKAVESVITDVHNACKNSFVHRIDSDHTYYKVDDNKYVRAKNCVKNVASENLRTGKFASGRLNHAPVPKDPRELANLTYIVLKDPDEIFYREPHTPTLTLAEAEERKKSQKYSPTRSEAASKDLE